MDWPLLPTRPFCPPGEKGDGSLAVSIPESVTACFVSGISDTDHSAELGYSSEAPQLSLEARRRLGANVEKILEGEVEAAKAPLDTTS